MPIYKPTQYQCNNINEHQKIIVVKKDWLYRFLRHIFGKDKDTIIVDYNGSKQKVCREDCMIISDIELQCELKLLDTPYLYRSSYTGITSNKKFNYLQVGLNNITLKLHNDSVITFSANTIKQIFEKQNYLLTKYDPDIIMSDEYTDEYVINRIIKNRLEKWDMMYCPICGKNIEATFNTDRVDIINNCKCGKSKPKTDNMTYKEFAIWLSSDVNSAILSYNKKLWIK